MCYNGGNGPAQKTAKQAREAALKQIEILAKARESGCIDEQTAVKAQAALTKELANIYQLKEKLDPGNAAEFAASMIVEMEGGKLP